MNTRRNQQIELNEMAKTIKVSSVFSNEKSFANALATLSYKVRHEYGDGMVHFEIIDPRSGEFKVGADKFHIIRKGDRYQVI